MLSVGEPGWIRRPMLSVGVAPLGQPCRLGLSSYLIPHLLSHPQGAAQHVALSIGIGGSLEGGPLLPRQLLAPPQCVVGCCLPQKYTVGSAWAGDDCGRFESLKCASICSCAHSGLCRVLLIRQELYAIEAISSPPACWHSISSWT